MHKRANGFAPDEAQQVAACVHVEYDDGLVGFLAQREGGHVHHFEIPGNDVIAVYADIALCHRVFLGVGGIDTVHTRTLQNHIRVNLQCSKRSRGVRGEVRISGTGTENHHATFLKMADGPAPDKRFGNLIHVER